MTDTDIGSLESQEKGSARRLNANKPVWSFMPLHQIAGLMIKLLKETEPPSLADLTNKLGWYQAKGDFASAFDVLEVGYRYLMHTQELTFNEACEKVIYVWEFGAKKYAKFNWMKGMPWSELISSAQRHVMAMLDGSSIDPDSGELHAAHFICNAMMLVHYVDHYPEGNDLPVEWFK